MPRLQLTSKEVSLAIAIAVLGFIFSTSQWLGFLNGLDAFKGFIVYYAVLYVALYALSKAGLVIFNFKIDTTQKTLGLLLITFSFFLITGWSNQYVQLVTTGSMAGASNVFYQCEDGVAFWFWNTVMNVQDIEAVRYLAFVLTPFVLTLAGGLLVTETKLGELF